MAKARWLTTALAMAILSIALGGCWGNGDDDLGSRPIEKPKDPPKVLYERLGGKEGIFKVVDDFLPRMLANPRVNFARKGAPAQWQWSQENIARFKTMLVLYLCRQSGGPEVYSGRDMYSVHQNMRITGGEFDLFKRELKESLKKFKVKDEDQKELLKIIENSRKDIGEVP